jgi:hypothetical protein
MSATNFTPISLYYSTTASAVPLAANLVPGELAINTADGKLYYEDSSGVVQVLASKAGALGDVVGPASATDNALARFDLTTGKLIQNSVGILSDAGVLTGLTGLTSSGSITLSSLTSGRVTYAGASGLLTDSANLLYSGTDLTVYGLTVGRGAGAISTNTVVGSGALAGSNTGANNAAFGSNVLGVNTSGTVNAGFGINSLAANTTGASNSGFGVASLSGNTTGSFNTAVGQAALQLNTTASNNTAVGYQAGYTNTTGTNLVAVGYQTLYSNTTGNNNVAVGYGTLGSNITGSENVAMGYGALDANTTAVGNTALGHDSLGANSTGASNVAVGYHSLLNNTTVSNNTAIGYQAGYANTTGQITAVGHRVLYGNTTGAGNTGVGGNDGSVGSALLSNTTGNYNIAVGTGALLSNTTASNNTAVGYQAGYSNTTGAGFTALGYQAGYSNTANFVTAVGQSALYTNTGVGNTAFGRVAGYSVTSGTYNTILGHQAGYALTTGSFNTFVGAQNSVGEGCGGSITTGAKNTILGGFSGNQGGLDIRTASNYIVLSDGDGNPRGVFNNNGTFFIGAFTSPAGTQRLVLTANGSAGIEPMLFNELRSTAATENYVFFYRNGSQVGAITNTLSATAYVTSSDYRLKENITPMTGALATVAQLKPVTYKWKATGENGQGFIAHELQAVVPDCVSGEKDAIDADGKPKYQGIDTSFLVATLTAAIQELKAEFDAYKATHP